MITSALSSPAQIWKLHQKLHQMGLSKLSPVGFPYQENLWANLNASIHASTINEDLVIAGKNVVIKAGVTFKGLVVLGNNVVIESGAIIENSIIEAGTYVGKTTRIENSVVRKNRLHRIDRGISLDISEKQILGRTRLSARLFNRETPRTKNRIMDWQMVQPG